jgi:predicted transcriptional regulator
VVRHLWEGEANKAIAHELGMSEGTVKVHIKNIMKKLHATNRTQVVLITQKMFGKSESLQAEKISNMQRSLLAPQTARAGEGEICDPSAGYRVNLPRLASHS